jgi:hypothetical protein
VAVALAHSQRQDHGPRRRPRQRQERPDHGPRGSGDGRPSAPRRDNVDAAGAVLVSAEDGASDTVRPRFDAARGDPSKARLLGDDEPSTSPRRALWSEPSGVGARSW